MSVEQKVDDSSAQPVYLSAVLFLLLLKKYRIHKPIWKGNVSLPKVRGISIPAEYSLRLLFDRPVASVVRKIMPMPIYLVDFFLSLIKMSSEIRDYVKLPV